MTRAGRNHVFDARFHVAPWGMMVVVMLWLVVTMMVASAAQANDAYYQADPPWTISGSGATANSSCKEPPYPFGLRGGGRGVPESDFSLTCVNGTFYLPLNNNSNLQYKVLRFTENSVVIDPLNENPCKDLNLKNFTLTEMPNFWVSPNNALLLSCSNNSSSCNNSNSNNDNSEINFPLAFATESVNGSNCSNGTCLYRTSGPDDTSMWKNSSSWPQESASMGRQLGCNVSRFSSWVVESQNQTNFEATMGLELMWSLPGVCGSSGRNSCSQDSSCNNTNISDQSVTRGHNCWCLDGFVGDGYESGLGCHPVYCNATLVVNCKCTTTLQNGVCEPNHRIGVGFVIAAGLAAGGVIAVIMCTFFACLHVYRTHNKDRTRLRETRELARLFSLGKGTTTFFTYKELQKATKGFSAERKVGGGAFGTVYAGKLQDGTLIAVKSINASNTQGMEQVVNEVTLLSSVNHTNLVHLLGCCLEAKDPLLVYEFVENGTLSEHLQGLRGGRLDWPQRIKIATETAGALAYLHSARPPIYHRDVKSSNILLDANLKTKVADFGLSRTVLTDESHVSTVPQGTPGYLDPEYHQYFHLSDKSDVYSFGVVLVEIITAMKVIDFSRDRREVSLAAMALQKITSGNLDEIIDPFLEVERNALVHTMVHRVAELAFRCLATNKDSRPAMIEVANELASIQIASLEFRVDNQLYDHEPFDYNEDHNNSFKFPDHTVSPVSVLQQHQWSSFNNSIIGRTTPTRG